MPPEREQTKLWEVVTPYGKVRLLRATYVRQSFARHMHEDFPVGVIERGALEFAYRGEYVVAPVGSINLANPGEPHTGQAAIEAGWTYRMLYVDLDVLQSVASEIVGRPRDIPFFQSGVLNDPELARQILNIHIHLEDDNIPRLEQESCIFDVLTRVIVRHADDNPLLKLPGREHRAVTRAREYLEAHYAENVTLDDLAREAFLSPYHLARVFTDEVGLPPHAYLTQVRIQRAKLLLAGNCPITEIAYDVGFGDQSHLNRRFKRIIGMTPGQYRKNVQDT